MEVIYDSITFRNCTIAITNIIQLAFYNFQRNVDDTAWIKQIQLASWSKILPGPSLVQFFSLRRHPRFKLVKIKTILVIKLYLIQAVVWISRLKTNLCLIYILYIILIILSNTRFFIATFFHFHRATTSEVQQKEGTLRQNNSETDSLRRQIAQLVRNHENALAENRYVSLLVFSKPYEMCVYCLG